MKKRLLLLVFSFLGMVTICSSQQAPVWVNWTQLAGTWIGEGEGQPGQGTGTFSFSFNLDSNILIRKSHSNYPASTGNQKIVHEDLMIIYPDQNGVPARAVYFDNERHTIFYSVTFSDNSIILTSDKVTNAPIFRLVYTLLDNDTVNTRFEISQDGFKYTPYVEGKSKRVKSGNQNTLQDA